MAKKKTTIPQYGTVMRKGVQYYRTRILVADAVCQGVRCHIEGLYFQYE